MPEILEKKVWKRPIEGLLLTAGVTLIVANLFDLSSISMMGSAGFLIIFASVNVANARLHRNTRSSQWLSLIGALVCCLALVALVWHTALETPSHLWILIGMIGLAFAVELVYREATGRSIKRIMSASVHDAETMKRDR